MIHTDYAHVVTVDDQAVRFPTRFAALQALLSTVTAAGAVVERRPIPTDSGLEAISIFNEGGDDQFVIMRINADTFTLHRRPRIP